MNLSNLVEGFVYGELSPKMAGQISSNAYRQSAKILLNMIPDVRGPASSRPGWIHAFSKNAETGRLFNFQATRTEAYACLFTDGELDVIPNQFPNRGLNYLINGRFSTDGIGWNLSTTGEASYSFEEREEVTDINRLTVTPGEAAGETVVMRQSFIVPDGAADYELILDGLFAGPTSDEALVVEVGTTLDANDVVNTSLYGYLTYQKIDITAPGVTTLYLRLTFKDWSNQTDIETTESYLDLLRVQDAAVSIATTNIATSPYTAVQLKTLSAYRVPNSDKLYLLHEGVTPYELIKNSPTSWTLQAITFTAMPTDWTAGSFPTTVTFHQGRAIWGGVNDKPETFYLSKTANYTDMTVGVLADDSFSFTIDDVGLIRWILSSRNLLLGTVNGEYVVSAENKVITPSDCNIELQSAHGSSEVPPVKVGTETAFISVDQKAIRSMAFYWEDDGWVATNLTFSSEHLTEVGITEVHIAKNPEPVLWSTVSNGRLIGCSYQYRSGEGSQDKRISGWHRHQTAWPIISSMVMDDFGQSVPWIAAKVTVNGVNKIHVGYFDFLAENKSYLDNSVYKTYNSPVTTITGLDHLEGYEVEVLADGATQANKTVSGGQIELDVASQQVFVGLGFSAKLETQPVALLTKEGAIKSQFGRWNDAQVYIVNSALPLIEGVRVAEHEASTRMGDAQQLFTGYVFDSQLGWERNTTLTIEQDLPYPLTISHIAGRVEKT